MTRACRRLVVLVVLALALGAPPAFATFHEIMVREVYPGSTAQPNSEYVELQMWASAQHFVAGHSIGVYNAQNDSVGTATFSNDVSGGANQSTLLAATATAESEFGFTADIELPSGLLNPAGGAVCWESLDCVSWGGFSSSTPSPSASPANPLGIPDGMALRRTIARRCATLLEEVDDSNDSAADFFDAFPAPRPNSSPPSEHACSGQVVAGGAYPGGGTAGPGNMRPQTRLGRGPGHQTRDRTPTFRFSSSAAGSTYFCKLDRRSFKRCHSPFTAPRLDFGRHLFEVKARAPDGATDGSPAIYKFSLLKTKSSKRR